MLDLEAQVDLYFKWENALNEPEPNLVLIASLESTAHKHEVDLWEMNNLLLNTYTAAIRGVTDWNPVLHPRGRDGRFIELLGRVKLFNWPDRKGKMHEGTAYGTVKEIKPGRGYAKSKPSSVDIVVELEDGELVDVKPYHIAAAPKTKADVTMFGRERKLKEKPMGVGLQEPGMSLASGEPEAITAADWNPDLHPRGRDGQFIEVLGLVNLFDFKKDRFGKRIPEGRGKVVDIKPTRREGDPDIIVELDDGSEVTVKPSQIESGLNIKAKLNAPDARSLQEYEGRRDPDAEVARARFQLATQLDLPARTPEGEALKEEIRERLSREDGGLSDEQVMNYREALNEVEVRPMGVSEAEHEMVQEMGTDPNGPNVPILTRNRFFAYEEAGGDLSFVEWVTQGEPEAEAPEAPAPEYDTDREVGNLMVGDEVILPGDIPGEVIDFEFPEDRPDSIVIVTDNGTYFGKTTDILPSKRRT